MSSLNRLNPIARALLVSHAVRKPRFFASAGLAMMLPAVAAQAQDVTFNIPAQALGSALAEFGKQANVEVLYSPDLVNGQRSNSLRGTFSAEQGIAQLLRGTKVSYSLQGSSLILTPVGDGKTMELGPTNVTGAALGSTTENTGSYTTGAMRTATKLPLTLRETPQAVTVITRQRMDDQAMNTLDDVVKSTPGMSAQKLGPDRQRYYARGFQVDNLMYDGIPTNVGSGAADIISSADLAMYDHVEIVRGATGLMQGAGNPSAAINMVRKRPTADTQISITNSAGSWDRYRSEVDAGGSLNEQGTLRGRVVGAYQNNHSFQDNVQTERGVYYGILEADLNPSTMLTFGASYQDDNNHIPWGGVPVAANGSDLHLSRSTYLGNDWDYWDKDSTFAFAKVEHSFDNDWKMTLAANKGWGKLNHLASKVNNRNNVFGQTLGGYRYDSNQTSTDLFASGPMKLFGREHELVVGASDRKEKLSLTERTDNSVYPNMDIYNWDPDLRPKPGVLTSSFWQHTDTEQKSAYVTGRFSLADPLHLILGSRLDWYDYSADTGTSHTEYKVTRNVTKYAGLIYDFDEHHSVYVSYTDVFKPQNYLTSGGGLLEPIVGKNYEIGIKGEYFDGALNASAAVFRMDQENRARALVDQTQCPTSATCYEAAGKVRAQGIDLEIQGALTPRWQIGAGYTYTEAKYLSDANKNNEGRPFDTDLPRHMAKLTSTYQLDGELERWRVGGTLYGQNALFNKGATYKTEQGAYTLLDLMVGFKPTDHIDARLNLNNVFDRKYYVSITDNPLRAENIYGDPRNLMLTVKYNF